MTWNALHELVANAAYKPGWEFRIYTTWQRDGDTLILSTDPGDCDPILEIGARVQDYADGYDIISVHLFHCSPADRRHRSRRWWRRWLLNRILLVERHETMEFYAIGPDRPFAPPHGAGVNLYEIKDKTP